MDKSRSLSRTHVLAAALGAIAGGIIVAIATGALPVILSRAMSGAMMRMGGEGCNPAEI